MDRHRAVVRRIAAVFQMARRRNIDFMASGVTYYELFSLVPLIILAFIGLTAVGGKGFATAMLTRLAVVLPPVGQDIVRTVLASNAGRSSVIGLLILGWAALQMFRSFDIAFSEIYGEDHAETFVEEMEDALIAVVTLAVSVALIVSAGSMVASFPGIPSLGLIWAVFTFVDLTIVFLPLYYVFTDVDRTFRGLLPGAAVAAAGWTALQSTFSLYTSTVGGSIYGVFGGILLLVLWMYLGNMLILLGAVVNYVRWENQ